MSKVQQLDALGDTSGNGGNVREGLAIFLYWVEKKTKFQEE
jgi:hypothetical protein